MSTTRILVIAAVIGALVAAMADSPAIVFGAAVIALAATAGIMRIASRGQ